MELCFVRSVDAQQTQMQSMGLADRGCMQVSAEQRNQAKRLAYGLLYGMGPMALSKELGCDQKTAADLSAAFLASLPGVVRRHTGACRLMWALGLYWCMSARPRHRLAYCAIMCWIALDACHQSLHSCLPPPASMAKATSWLQARVPCSATTIDRLFPPMYL